MFWQSSGVTKDVPSTETGDAHNLPAETSCCGDERNDQQHIAEPNNRHEQYKQKYVIFCYFFCQFPFRERLQKLKKLQKLTLVVEVSWNVLELSVQGPTKLFKIGYM